MVEGREEVLESLGVKRRSMEPGAEEGASAAVAKSSSSSGPKLGIKRRRGTEAEAREAEAEAAEAEATEGADDAVAEGEPRPEAAPAAPASVLGNDETSLMLATFFKTRPALREQVPPRAFQLHRTHGRYIGDGRAQRTIKIGFRPSLVLFTVPPYLDGQMPRVERDGTLIDPPLHRQPTFVDEGFVVDEPFNITGDFFLYVVFKDDGQPLELEQADPKKKRGRGSEGGEVAKGLGIRRRK